MKKDKILTILWQSWNSTSKVQIAIFEPQKLYFAEKWSFIFGYCDSGKIRRLNMNLFHFVITFVTVQLATIQSQICDVLSPLKKSPLDSTVPFKVENFSNFDFSGLHKKYPVKIYQKSNIFVELSDKNAEKSPTFSGGGICGNENVNNDRNVNNIGNVSNDVKDNDNSNDDDDDDDCVFRFERLVFNWKSEEENFDNGKEFPLETHLLFVNKR